MSDLEVTTNDPNYQKLAEAISAVQALHDALDKQHDNLLCHGDLVFAYEHVTSAFEHLNTVRNMYEKKS